MKKEHLSIQGMIIPRSTSQHLCERGTGSSFDMPENNNISTEIQIHNDCARKEVYHFDCYDITVLLSADGRFCGICSVKETRDFLSTEQFLKNTPSIDTDDFYTGQDS